MSTRPSASTPVSSTSVRSLKCGSSTMSLASLTCAADDLVLVEDLEDLVARPLGHPARDQRLQLVVVLHPHLVGGVPRVLDELRLAHRGEQPLRDRPGWTPRSTATCRRRPGRCRAARPSPVPLPTRPWTNPVAGVVHDHVADDEHQRLVERDVDVVALAGALAPEQRHRRPHGRRDPGDRVGEAERRRRRRRLRPAVDEGEAAAGLGDRAEARALPCTARSARTRTRG